VFPKKTKQKKNRKKIIEKFVEDPYNSPPPQCPL